MPKKEETYNAVLYNRDHPVMECEIDDMLGTVLKVGEVKDPLFLPIVLQHEEVTPPTVNKWLMKRRVPKEREGLEPVKRMYGHFENYRHMASLTDQYWFKRTQKDRWSNVNFFTRRYPTALGQAQFTPWSVTKKQLREPGPDLTTNGLCRKQWVQADDMTSYLIKAGSKDYAQEPLSEILASVTLGNIGIIPYVSYELCVNGMRICSKCKNFVTADTEFVPAQNIFTKEPKMDYETDYEHFIRMCRLYGIEDAKDHIDRMILADIVIGNEDRHLGNFGFIRSAVNGKLTGFAPLFDFGRAFHEFAAEDRTKPSDIFAGERQRVMHERRLTVDPKLMYTDEIERLIDMYPDLSVRQKEAVKEGIKSRQGLFWRPEEEKKND